MSLTPEEIQIINARGRFERSLYSPNAGRADGHFNTKPAPPPPPPIPKEVNNNALSGWGRIEKGFIAPRKLRDNPGFRQPNAVSATQGQIPTSAGGRSSAVPPPITVRGGAGGFASGIAQTLAPGLIQQGPNYLNPRNPNGIFAPNPTTELLKRAIENDRTAPPGYDRNLDGSLTANPFKVLLDPRSDGSPLNPNGLWNRWRDRNPKIPYGPSDLDDARFKGMGGNPAPLPRTAPNGIKGPFDIFDKLNPFKPKPKPTDPNAPIVPPNSNLPDAFNPQEKRAPGAPPIGQIKGKGYIVQISYSLFSVQRPNDPPQEGTTQIGVYGPIGAVTISGNVASLNGFDAAGNPVKRDVVTVDKNDTRITEASVSGATPFAPATPDPQISLPQPPPSLPPEWEPPKMPLEVPIFFVPGPGTAPTAQPKPGDRPPIAQPGSPDGSRQPQQPQSPQLQPPQSPQLQPPQSPQLQPPQQPPQVQQPQLPQIQTPPQAQPQLPLPKPSGTTKFPPDPSSQWSDPPFPGPYTKQKTEIEKNDPTKEFQPLPIPPIFPRPTDPDGNFDRPRQEEEQRRQDASKPLPQPKPRCQNSCSAGLEMGQEQINNKLDKTLKALSTGSDVASLALLPIINNKLGDQLPGGIGGKLTRFTKWMQFDRILNALTFITVLHNASMLSRSAAETLGELASQSLAVIGIKDDDNAPINVNEIIGKQADKLMASILGEEIWKGTKESWHKANRIISTASNIISTVRSITDSTRDVLEWTAENTGKIGNALKRWRVVGENAYKWMPERVTSQGRWHRSIDKAVEGIQSVEDTASSLAGAVGNVRSIQEDLTEVKEQKANFDKALKEATPKPSTENDITKAKAVAEKTASASPALAVTDREKGDVV